MTPVPAGHDRLFRATTPLGIPEPAAGLFTQSVDRERLPPLRGHAMKTVGTTCSRKMRAAEWEHIANRNKPCTWCLRSARACFRNPAGLTRAGPESWN